MMYLRYDVIGACLAGVSLHPAIDMGRLGYKVVRGIPQSIADQWWFQVDDTDVPMPKYIEPMDKAIFDRYTREG